MLLKITHPGKLSQQALPENHGSSPYFPSQTVLFTSLIVGGDFRTIIRGVCVGTGVCVVTSTFPFLGVVMETAIAHGFGGGVAAGVGATVGAAVVATHDHTSPSLQRNFPGAINVALKDFPPKVMLNELAVMGVRGVVEPAVWIHVIPGVGVAMMVAFP